MAALLSTKQKQFRKKKKKMAKQYSTEPNSRATQIKPHCSYFKAFTVQPQQQQQLQQQSTPPEAASVAAGIKMPLNTRASQQQRPTLLMNYSIMATQKLTKNNNNNINKSPNPNPKRMNLCQENAQSQTNQKNKNTNRYSQV